MVVKSKNTYNIFYSKVQIPITDGDWVTFICGVYHENDGKWISRFFAVDTSCFINRTSFERLQATDFGKTCMIGIEEDVAGETYVASGSNSGCKTRKGAIGRADTMRKWERARAGASGIET
jgi:hypothetical protein